MPRTKFSELEAKMAPESIARSDRRTEKLERRIQLNQLRKGRSISQAEIAKTMAIHQSEISRIEHRNDLYVSTLARYVAAIGANLEIRAVFPGGEVQTITLDPAN